MALFFIIIVPFLSFCSAGDIMCLLTTDDDENINKACFLSHFGAVWLWSLT